MGIQSGPQSHPITGAQSAFDVETACDLDMNKAFTAAGSDIVLTEKFARVNNLIDPPTRLQDPALMARAVLGNFRHLSRPD